MPSLGQYLDFFSRALCLSFLISGRGEGGGGAEMTFVRAL